MKFLLEKFVIMFIILAPWKNVCKNLVEKIDLRKNVNSCSKPSMYFFMKNLRHASICDLMSTFMVILRDFSIDFFMTVLFHDIWSLEFWKSFVIL